jgi:hypothetical protein
MSLQSVSEKLVFGARPVVLVIFAVVTAVMVFFASQLKVDAGFKKQIPLQHEYMKTFLDYEADFGGANRVLVAVMAKDGNMFSDEYMSTLQQVTKEVVNLEDTDDSRARSLFTPNVRFIEVVEDGISGGNVIPNDYDPSFKPGTKEQFDAIRGNIVKANILGRLVAKDWSGAMVWADIIPESDSQDQSAQGRLPEDRAPARGDPRQVREGQHRGRDHRLRQDGRRHRRRRRCR